METGRFKSCFISAPAGTDLSALRTELGRRNIRWSDQSRLQLGESILDAVRREVEAADFICAILPKDSENSNVLFELGMAQVRRKPVLTFVDPAIQLPEILHGIACARTSLDDEKAVAFHLNSFLRHASLKTKRRRTVTRIRPAKVQDTSWFHASLQTLETGQGSEFESLVARLLEESGVVVSRTPQEERDRPDMALWLDALQGSLGNPILVELKYGSLSEDQLADTEATLRSYMHKADAVAGLLIYFDQGRREFPSQKIKWPLVFRLSLRELIEFIRDGRLEQELIRRRNRAVHGQV